MKLFTFWESQKEKREKRAASLFKGIIAENSPNLWRDTDIQVHEAHRSTSRFNSKEDFIEPHYIKTQKSKTERILKASRSNRHIQTIPPSSSRIYILAKNTQSIFQDRS